MPGFKVMEDDRLTLSSSQQSARSSPSTGNTTTTPVAPASSSSISSSSGSNMLNEELSRENMESFTPRLRARRSTANYGTSSDIDNDNGSSTTSAGTDSTTTPSRNRRGSRNSTRTPSRRKDKGSDDEEEEKVEEKPKIYADKYRVKENEPYSHTYFVHTTIRASPLSKESPEQNYRGFYNLAILLLFVNNVRLIIENYTKYGLLMSLPGRFVPTDDWFWSFGIWITLIVHVLIALGIETFAIPTSDATKNTPLIVKIGHWINISLSLIIPTYLCWEKIYHPFMASIPLFGASITALKLTSYALVNADLRRERSQHVYTKRYEGAEAREAPVKGSFTQEYNPHEPRYPTNISLGNIFYFWVAPTLAYQPSFPRTPRFRKSFFFKRLLEFTSACFAIYFLIEQYAVPTLKNSLRAIDDFNVVIIAERILKLSVTSMYIWILGFYAFFHSFLNATAELLRFGDRRFYQCWWNASDIASYWRLWNMPVYNFTKRHIYLPMIINLRAPAWLAGFTVFFISALFHELLVAIPTKNIGGWGFNGMMGQIPLILFTHWLMGLRKKVMNWLSTLSGGDADERERVRSNVGGMFDTVGNLVFWISFCVVGQPVAIMMCYTEWVRKFGNGGQ